jgi:hypothetical protein
MQRDRKIYREAESRKAERHQYRKTDGEKGRLADRPNDRQTNRQTEKRRQTDG